MARQWIIETRRCNKLHVRPGSVPVDTCAEPYGVVIVVVLRLETRYGTAFDIGLLENRIQSGE